MKTLKICMLLLVASATTYAQKADRPVYVNPKVGINFSGLNDDLDGISNSGKAGYNLGADLRLGSGVVFFQPGVYYYQYNTQYTVVESNLLPNGQTTYETDIKVESIKVPAQMGIRILTTDLISLRANLGPAFNFPVKVESNDDFVLERGDYKNVNVGGVLGAGIDLAFFTFDLNYEFGLSDYVEFQNPNVETSSSKQYVVSFNVGIRL